MNPMTGIAGCCARVAGGHVTAEPTTTLMKSRRLIAFTKAGTTTNGTRLQQGFMTGEMGCRGQFAWQQSLGPNVRFVPKADMDQDGCDVRFLPKADVKSSQLSRLRLRRPRVPYSARRAAQSRVA